MALQPVATTINIGQDKIFSLVISDSAPPTTGAGIFAVADGIYWNPANKAGQRPYPVFYDGVSWQSLY
jgi:hypothetical protein